MYNVHPCTDTPLYLSSSLVFSIVKSVKIHQSEIPSLLRDNNCFQHLPSRREAFFHRKATRGTEFRRAIISRRIVSASGKHRKRNPHGMTVTTGGSFPWPVESHSSSPLLAASIPETVAEERVRTPLWLSLSLSPSLCSSVSLLSPLIALSRRNGGRDSS